MNKWQLYELEKEKLQEKNLSPEAYQKELIALAEWLKI